MHRYKSVRVGNKTRHEHDVIWETVHGPIPPGYEIHHKNGNGRDNRLENLIMLTKSEHRRLHARLKKLGKDVVDESDPLVIAHRKLSSDYYKNNAAAISAKKKIHYQEHRDEILAQKHQYHLENAKKRCDYMKQYSKTHKKEREEYRKKFVESHHEQLKQYWREYNKTRRKKLRIEKSTTSLP